MDFQLSAEQCTMQKMVSDFAQQEMAPHAAKWDEEKIFPKEVLRKAASLGLGGVYVKEDVGGSNLPRLDAAIIFEALARACPSTAAYLSIHNMVAWMIDAHASDIQRQKWLPDIVSMQKFASYCLTEPSSGSDAASLKTTARLEGDCYVLNGSKAFTSGGSVSDVYACMVRTGEAGAKGISCILVEKDTPGLSYGKQEVKLGWNSQPTSMVFFEECRVPRENLIGELNRGFNIALSGLNGGRVNVAACSLGGASECLHLARKYLSEREQFGKKLQDFQVLQFRLADMYTELEAARLMVHRAAHAIDTEHPETPLFCATAKRYATDVGFEVSNHALQMFGGYGYLREYPIERFFRDLRVHQILEGTNEIMRVIASRRLLDDSFIL